MLLYNYWCIYFLSLWLGRVAYTPEDDAAILSYVGKHKTETGGNRLWQEMEKQRVTGHSWQSMKYRYRVRLAKKQSEVVEVATTEEDSKASEGETKVIYLEGAARSFVIYFSVSNCTV